MTPGRPALAPDVQPAPTTGDKLVLRAVFPRLSPDALFDCWTRPEIITRWWAAAARVEPRRGGAYNFSWPEQAACLHGRYTAFDPGRRLAFTWQWDAPGEDEPQRLVIVRFEPTAEGGGACCTLTHGPYAASTRELAARASHLAWWQSVLRKLGGVDCRV